MDANEWAPQISAQKHYRDWNCTLSEIIHTEAYSRPSLHSGSISASLKLTRARSGVGIQILLYQSAQPQDFNAVL